MKVVGYIRVSTDKQDLDKQKHALLDYAQQHKLMIEQFINVAVSSRTTRKERRIDTLLEILETDDVLMAVELSRLGRNMLETLNIIDELSQRGIKLIFTRQPELSTAGSHAKLLLAVYSYFAETERQYISIRTKEGLAATKAQGQLLGRPKGSKNKKGSVLTPFRDQIQRYLELHLSIGSMVKIVNDQLETPVTYNAVKYFIYHDNELYNVLKNGRNT
jgi:DNA invertase Pin-like site-specific DNA recombinase